MADDRKRQIIEAARALVRDDPHSSLSVRSVAERAGVGASTLRHYFPSQHDLREAVYEAMFEPIASDLRIHEATVPARERLRECLVQLLPPTMPAGAPIDGWLSTISAAFGSSAAPEARAGWTSYVTNTRRQIIGWLRVLADEGAVAGGSEERSARLLLTVVDGLTIARIIPASHLDAEMEAAVLDDALTTVLRRD